MKGMAPCNPSGGQIRSFENSKFPDRFRGVLGAAGYKTARGWEQERKTILIELDDKNGDIFH
jgi:hypothetical protein